MIGRISGVQQLIIGFGIVGDQSNLVQIPPANKNNFHHHTNLNNFFSFKLVISVFIFIILIDNAQNYC
jgi:hypothetical protein